MEGKKSALSFIRCSVGFGHRGAGRADGFALPTTDWGEGSHSCGATRRGAANKKTSETAFPRGGKAARCP